MITTNPSTESTLDPPDGEIQEILILFYFFAIKLNKTRVFFFFDFYESKNKLFRN